MNKAKVGVLFFWLLELNLVLWLLVGSYFLPSKAQTGDTEFQFTQYMALAGFLLAACLQHWAYYNIYKPIKEKKKLDKERTSSPVS